MTHQGTHVTKGLLLQPRDQEGSLPVELVQMVSLPETSGPVDLLILVKLEMLVRRLLIWVLFESTHLPFSPCGCRPPWRESERHFRGSRWP
jgi:hypothetical protein